MKDQREGATFQIKVEGWSCLDYFWQYMSQWLEQIQGTAEFSPCKSTECSRKKFIFFHNLLPPHHLPWLATFWLQMAAQC